MKLGGVVRVGRRRRVLDFDIEVRPLAWYGGDFVTKQPTVIAWKFIGEKGPVEIASIGDSGQAEMVLEEEADMISRFLEAYDQADLVTGHFIRGFDLPVISAASLRLGGEPIGKKLSSDTKLDLTKASGISKSMENLSAMFEAKNKKYTMDTAKWAAANMLLPEGIELSRTRCARDVKEHIELRAKLLEVGALRPPVEWSPEGAGVGGYHA
jgi:hypothetical protein